MSGAAIWIATTVLLAWMGASQLSAAPFNRKFQFTQPDGTVLKLTGRGDEFQAQFTTEAGYTVVFDATRRAYCFARLEATGELTSTGVEAHSGNPASLGLTPGLRMSQPVLKQQVAERYQRWNDGVEVAERWAAQKAAMQQLQSQTNGGPQGAPPPFQTLGTKVGLTLLVDFSDEPGVVPQAEIVNFCNGDNYTGYGNNGSVKKFFLDNSNGKLLYTNVVTIYIRAPQPKTFYDNPTLDAGDQANILIKDVLDVMKALPNYATEILPLFDPLTVDGNNRIIACNIFYAGANSGVWMGGLWPHSYSLVNVGAQELSPGGKKVYKYQITDIGTSVTIATFCHENGHMLCGYPDLYDYDYDSSGGAGDFCLMGAGATGPNPSQICAYLKLASGWATVTELDTTSSLLASVTAIPGTNFNHFYRFLKPGTPTEYYLAENRQKLGRDAALPGAGVVVWHVDELGDRDDQRIAYNASHNNYELSLVQADNLYELQNQINNGDAKDPFYSGNTSAGYQNAFSDPSLPSARWWDGTPSGVFFSEFSVLGPTMTFQVGAGPSLQVVSLNIAGGNGNGRVDYNECNDFILTVTNVGNLDATAVDFTLSTTTPGMFVVGGKTTVARVAAGAAVTLPPFKVGTTPGFACGIPGDFSLGIKSDQHTQTRNFRISTGAVGPTVQYDNSTPLVIPDNFEAGVYSPITISGFSGAIGKLAVAVHIQHTYDGDLTLRLISPQGVTNLLSAFVGGSGDNYGASCVPESFRTTFDDDATASIFTGAAPFLGTFQPLESLAGYKGKSGADVNGTWRLQVVDDTPTDTGTIQCWSLIISPSVCDDGGGLCPGTDLAIAMADAPHPIFVGSNMVYTITVTNHGPNEAKGVVVTHNLPAAVAFLSASASQGSVGSAGSVVTANIGSVPAFSTATVQVNVLPLTAGLAGSSASVISLEPEVDPANNTALITSLIQNQTADLRVTFAASPNPAVVGGTLTYVATVVNNGPSSASGVVLTNTLPLTVQVASAVSSQGIVAPAGNTVVCYIGGMTNGATATATIQVVPLVAGTIVANARVASNLGDPALANNTATIGTVVGESSDLAISVQDSPDPIVVNSNVTYLVTVTNRGPNAATAVVVNGQITGSLTLVSSNLSQGTLTVGAGTGVWNIGSLPAGGTVTMTLVGKGTAVGTVTFSAGVSATQSDPDTGDNSAATTTTVANPFVSIVGAGATLTSESQSPANGALDIGETVAIKFRLRNAGNVANTNLVATLLATGGVTSPSGAQTYGVLPPGGLPVEMPFSFTAAGVAGGTVTATLQITDGGNALSNVGFSFTLPRSYAFTNSAAITIPDSGNASPYPSTLNVSGVSGTVGSVSATLASLNHTYPPDVDVLLVGPTGQKVILMGAAGGPNAVANTTVTFSDSASQPVPESSQINSTSYRPGNYNPSPSFAAPAPGTPYSTAMSAFANVNPNGTWSLYIVDRNAGDSGSVASGWRMALNVISPVNALGDLGIASSVSPAATLVGNNLTWSVVVTNLGPSAQNGVVVTNTLSAGLSLQSVTGSQGVFTTNANQVICSIGSFGTNGTATITIVAKPSVAGSVSVASVVAGSEIDLNTANNSVTTSASNTLPVADVGVGITTGAASGIVGSNLSLTLTATNHGGGNALGTTVNLPFAGGATFQSASLSQGTFTTNGSSVTCNFGDLLPGEVVSAFIVVAPQSAGSMVNTATVATQSSDTNAANNSASVTLSIAPQQPIIVAAGANMLSESLALNSAVDAGETVTVSLSLANVGQLPTANLSAALQASGGVGSPSGAQNYGVLAPGGSSVARNFTFTAPNTPGALVIATLALTDNGSPLASVAFEFQVSGTVNFSNSAAITIPDHGVASPYPSTITVSGVNGLLNTLSVKLKSITHSFPADIDALLVGPQGQSVMLVSDAGGGFSVTNVSLTLADGAGASLPELAALTSGTFLPTDFDAGDYLPSPAPEAAPGTALSAFTGTDPNGEWSLFVQDDSTGDLGAIGGGWELSMTFTQPITPFVNPTPAQLAGTYDANALTFQITVTGQAGLTYILQASTDLTTWSNVSTNTASGGGTFSYTDTNVSSNPQRYYRAVQLLP